MKTFRKLQEGDFICMCVDYLASPPTLELSINGGEFAHKFTLAGGSDHTQYLFGAALSMEHELLLIPDSSLLDALPTPLIVSSSAIHSDSKTHGDTASSRLLAFHSQPDAPTRLYTWDMSSHLRHCASGGLNELAGYSKSDALRLCSTTLRVTRSLLALTVADNENAFEGARSHTTDEKAKTSSVSSPFEGAVTDWLIDAGVLREFISLAFRAHSSSLRLACGKVLRQTLPLLSPHSASKIVKASLSSQSQSEDVPLLAMLLASIGQSLNPYSGSGGSGSLLIDTRADYPVASMRQCTDLFSSLCRSPLRLWWTELADLYQWLLPRLDRASRALCESSIGIDSLSQSSCLRLMSTGSTQQGKSSLALGDGRVNDLIGLLATCGGWLASQALVPGAAVTHYGASSSLSERFVVLGYSPISTFGETLIVSPTGSEGSSDGSTDEESLGSSSLVSFDRVSDTREVVFSNYLQSEQPKTSIAPSVKHALHQSSSMHPLAALLARLIATDSSDPRPPSSSELEAPVPTSSPVERSLTLESPHPYRDNTDEVYEISIPGASELVVIFDPQTKTEANYDYLRFFKDASQTSYWGQEKVMPYYTYHFVTLSLYLCVNLYSLFVCSTLALRGQA